MEDYKKKYEELNKEHEEAFRKAKEWYHVPDVTEEEKGLLEQMFPKLKISEEDRIIDEMIKSIKGDMVLATSKDKQFAIAWLEKQKQKRSEKWTDEDENMLQETLYFIQQYQQSNKCTDENGMQNSVSCEKWLKSLQKRFS